MQLKSPIWYNGAKGGLMIRTSSIACILYPIKESKAEAIQLFGRPDTWPCIPQATRPEAQTQTPGFLSDFTTGLWWCGTRLLWLASLSKEALPMTTKDKGSYDLK